MTREQIIEILKNPHWFLNGKLFESDFERIADAILALPLDVPTDEEIQQHCDNATSIVGIAKWMRDTIILRNMK